VRYTVYYTERIGKRCRVEASSEDEARSLFFEGVVADEVEIETYDCEIDTIYGPGSL
jgi:hypothetical protein